MSGVSSWVFIENFMHNKKAAAKMQRLYKLEKRLTI